MDLKLTGKVALVAGASQGLGFAIAKELYKEGASIALLSRSEANLDKAKASLQSAGKGELFTVAADLSHKEEVEKALRATLDHFGGVDILLANAGGPPVGRFESITDEDYYLAFETNFMSTVRLIRGILPVMRERGGGRIGIITSTSVKEPIEGLLLSNSIRAGVTGLARTLASETAKDNILVNCFAPGRFHTERVAYLDQKIADTEGTSPQEVENRFVSSIPVGRYGEPEELAKVACFALSFANTYMTGQTFVIDGGKTGTLF